MHKYPSEDISIGGGERLLVVFAFVFVFHPVFVSDQEIFVSISGGEGALWWWTQNGCREKRGFCR